MAPIWMGVPLVALVGAVQLTVAHGGVLHWIEQPLLVWI
jgi:hypothetical protein